MQVIWNSIYCLVLNSDIQPVDYDLCRCVRPFMANADVGCQIGNVSVKCFLSHTEPAMCNVQVHNTKSDAQVKVAMNDVV